MEENFDVLRGVGLVDNPVTDYNIVYGMTVLAMMSPMIIVIYIYAIYTIYLFIQKKRKESREAKQIESDPDFEEDNALEETKKESAGPSREEAKKTN